MALRHPLRTAEILAVGSELLSPHRTDTNSLYVTEKLNDFGIELRGKAIVGDETAEIEARVRGALTRVDLVVLTGGLGPTEDDVTREGVAAALDLAMEEDPEIVAAIEARFARRQMPMPQINRRQAQVPRGAEPLANPNGTAPGLWIERGDQAIVLLPGPPREMRAMFESAVMPRLERRSGGLRLRRRVIKTTGWPESRVDEVAAPIYRAFAHAPIPIQTTILASPGQIELHLAAAGDAGGAADSVLELAVRALVAPFSAIVFSTDGRSLEEVVGTLLRDRGWRVGAAESCTGGLVLGRLTNVPGSSRWVTGGIIAYDNVVKIEQLGVSQDLLDAHGAVSEPVARAMAEGVCDRLKCDVGIGVTGIAGPDGGSAEKPIGTVAIAVAIRTMSGDRADDLSVESDPRIEVIDDVVTMTNCRTFAFIGDRQMVRTQAVQAALDMVRRGLE